VERTRLLRLALFLLFEFIDPSTTADSDFVAPCLLTTEDGGDTVEVALRPSKDSGVDDNETDELNVAAAAASPKPALASTPAHLFASFRAIKIRLGRC
jgi:hypothetical protein